MRTGLANRLWMAGGVLGAVLLLAIGWAFFIGPQRSQTRSLQNDTVATDLRVSALRHKLVELRLQNEQLPQFRTQLARYRQALPVTSSLSDLLREMQVAGDSTGVAVSGFIVGASSEVTGVATPIYAVPVSLTATGTAAQLNRFLDQLQQIQPRALLISSANAVPADEGGSLAGPVTLTFAVQAFVAPVVPAGSQPSAAPTN
jgi:Tfp pilus assembly protein PilO